MHRLSLLASSSSNPAVTLYFVPHHEYTAESPYTQPERLPLCRTMSIRQNIFMPDLSAPSVSSPEAEGVKIPTTAGYLDTFGL